VPDFFLGERYPWRNHACHIWWRSLKGFRGSCGSNFSISYWLCWSSLQHSHTTVRACDNMSVVHIVCGMRRKTSSSVCLSRRSTASATFSEFAAELGAGSWYRSIATGAAYLLLIDICRRPVALLLRDATCGPREFRPEVQHTCYFSNTILLLGAKINYQPPVDVEPTTFATFIRRLNVKPPIHRVP